jgi:hypothetical protein
VERFLGYSQEIRSSVVFSLLQDQFHCDSGPDGMPISDPKWHYVVSTEHGLRTVCQHVFLLVYPVSVTTLQRLKARIENGCTCAHAKLEEGGSNMLDEDKACSMRDDIIGWYISDDMSTSVRCSRMRQNSLTSVVHESSSTFSTAQSAWI